MDVLHYGLNLVVSFTFVNIAQLKHKQGKNFRTAPYLIMHVHLTGDTLKNKAPYMDV